MSRTVKKTHAHSGFWSGALFGSLLGIGSLLMYQYFSGILRRPRLISKAVLSGKDQFETKEALAMFIAADNLRSGIQTRFLPTGVAKNILHAGYRNFRESWARDFGFATYGLLSLGQFEVVKDTLEAFLWFQKQNGQLPVKLYSINVLTRFFHSLFEREQPFELILKPKYKSAHGAPSLDGQAMLLIAAQNYVHESGDTTFLQDHWEQFKSAITWLTSHQKNAHVLLHQGGYTDWADSVNRRGYVLYTNVVYWQALIAMELAAKQLDRQEQAKGYRIEAESLLKAINDRLWRSESGYFATSDQLDQFSSAGNLLAIAWGLTTPEQTISILKFMEAARLAEPVPTRVAYPSYPRSLIAIENLLGGMGIYHTESSWLWIGAWHVIAWVKTGDMDKAQELMGRIVDVIVRDKKINEVYRPDGQPLNSFWYKSESPLIWNAGMVIYADRLFSDQKQKDIRIAALLIGKKKE